MNFDNPQENELEDLSKEEDSHSIASEKSNQNLQQLQNENKKEEDKLPDCCGVLGIEFIKATNLPIADIKTSDPYVKLYGKTNRSIYYFGKTKIIKKNPKSLKSHSSPFRFFSKNLFHFSQMIISHLNYYLNNWTH